MDSEHDFSSKANIGILGTPSILDLLRSAIIFLEDVTATQSFYSV